MRNAIRGGALALLLGALGGAADIGAIGAGSAAVDELVQPAPRPQTPFYSDVQAANIEPLEDRIVVQARGGSSGPSDELDFALAA